MSKSHKAPIAASDFAAACQQFGHPRVKGHAKLRLFQRYQGLCLTNDDYQRIFVDIQQGRATFIREKTIMLPNKKPKPTRRSSLTFAVTLPTRTPATLFVVTDMHARTFFTILPHDKYLLCNGTWLQHPRRGNAITPQP